MEIEAHPPGVPRPVTDEDRQTAADVLQRACGDGRLTLEEFSDRVGAVWAADGTDQVAAATAGLEQPAPVGSGRTVRHVINVVGEQRLRGRWRLPGRLRVVNLVGEVDLDLCEVVVGQTLPDNVIDITVFSLIGEVNVTVPEGIEVDVSGFVLIGERDIRLAPVPRRVGTPLIRLHLLGLVGEVTVCSRPAG
jgi:Predicted membrane protein